MSGSRNRKGPGVFFLCLSVSNLLGKGMNVKRIVTLNESLGKNEDEVRLRSNQAQSYMLK